MMRRFEFTIGDTLKGVSHNLVVFSADKGRPHLGGQSLNSLRWLVLVFSFPEAVPTFPEEFVFLLSEAYSVKWISSFGSVPSL